MWRGRCVCPTNMVSMPLGCCRHQRACLGATPNVTESVMCPCVRAIVSYPPPPDDCEGELLVRLQRHQGECHDATSVESTSAMVKLAPKL